MTVVRLTERSLIERLHVRAQRLGRPVADRCWRGEVGHVRDREGRLDLGVGVESRGLLFRMRYVRMQPRAKS